MAGHYKGPKRYEYLKDMSIEELEELLKSDDLHLDDGEEFYDAVVNEIVQRERKNPTGRIPGVDEARREFQAVYCSPERKGELLFPDEEGEEAPVVAPITTAVGQSEEQKKRRRVFLVRGLAVAAMIILCVTTILPPALGYESFAEMIGHWNDTVFRFVLPNQKADDSSDTADEYESLAIALEENGVTAAIAPQIPDEFDTVVVEAIRYSDLKRTDYNAFYTCGDRNISIYIIQRDVPVETRSYEKDGTLVDEYKVNDVVHYIYENNGNLSAIWYNGAFECSLRADVTTDEIKTMIDSIYEGL